MRALAAKLNHRLMPMLLAMYVLAFLNRTNLSFAKESFQADTGIGNAAFAFAASIFFVGYALLEVPSNLMLHRVGARLWLSRIMVSWGIVAAATAFVHTESLFYLVRILLGITEAGFFPGVILFLTYWYPPSVRGRAMGIFYFGAPLASVIGGPLSGAMLDMEGWGGLHGWQWMFLLQGLAASAMGVVVFFALDSRPQEAGWLTDAEKAQLAEGLAQQKHDPHSSGELKKALANPRVLLLAAIYFTIQLGIYGFLFFLPTQVAGLLHTKVGPQVGLVTALPWMAAMVGLYLLPRWTDATGHVRALAAGSLLLGGASLGASVLLASPPLALAALCLACAGMMAVQPVFWTLPNYLLQGASLAGGLALINALGTFGGFVAPNLRNFADEASGFSGAGVLALGALVMLGAALILLVRIPERP